MILCINKAHLTQSISRHTFFDGVNIDWILSADREAVASLLALYNHLTCQLLLLLLLLRAVCVQHSIQTQAQCYIKRSH